MMSKLYIIATRKHGPLMYWRAGRLGYTPDRRMAGVYSEQESAEIVEASSHSPVRSEHSWRIDVNEL